MDVCVSQVGETSVDGAVLSVCDEMRPLTEAVPPCILRYVHGIGIHIVSVDLCESGW